MDIGFRHGWTGTIMAPPRALIQSCRSRESTILARKIVDIYLALEMFYTPPC